MSDRSKIIMCVFEDDIKDMTDGEFGEVWAALGKVARRRGINAAAKLAEDERLARLRLADAKEMTP